MITNDWCPSVSIKIRGVDFPARPIVLDFEGIDVILGINWLAKWKAVVQCSEKTMSLTTPNGKNIEFMVTKSPESQGTVNHLSSGPTKNIKVVCEFSDVFPKDLPGMPPECEIEFIIDLLPGTAPISKRPYRMAFNELEELKK